MASMHTSLNGALRQVGIPQDVIAGFSQSLLAHLNSGDVRRLVSKLQARDDKALSWVDEKFVEFQNPGVLEERKAAKTSDNDAGGRNEAAPESVGPERGAGNSDESGAVSGSGSEGANVEPWISPFNVSVYSLASAIQFSIGKTGKVRLDLGYINHSGSKRNGRNPVYWHDKHVTTFDFDECGVWVALLTGVIDTLINPSGNDELFHNPPDSQESTVIGCKHQGRSLYLSVRGKHVSRTRDGKPEERVVLEKKQKKKVVVRPGEVVNINHALSIPIVQVPSILALFLRAMQSQDDGNGLGVDELLSIVRASYLPYRKA